LRFSAPFGGLRGNVYDDHLRLIGKRVVDFLLVLIELFSFGFTAEVLQTITVQKSAISLQRGPVVPNFRVHEVAPPTILFSRKTRLNGLSYGQIFILFCHNARF